MEEHELTTLENNCWRKLDNGPCNLLFLPKIRTVKLNQHHSNSGAYNVSVGKHKGKTRETKH
jgi:hypothetical protein